MTTAAELAALGNTVHAERCHEGWVTEGTRWGRIRQPCPLCDQGQEQEQALLLREKGRGEHVVMPWDKRYLCPECGRVAVNRRTGAPQGVEANGMLWWGVHTCINGHTWELTRADIGLLPQEQKENTQLALELEILS